MTNQSVFQEDLTKEVFIGKKNFSLYFRNIIRNWKSII
jgi:hypothetical protein